ncbi:hypothetical protein KC342_g16160 [Hortaea werneckii]|nr:hypothetical protein KC342_g16160 [Hortaea werneckii]KAI7378269.1 hypothetical protein KC328_g13972 [Hortaea werneckii]
MRLLKSTADHDLSLTEDLDEEDIPPYAILSHTWGSNEEEVTYKDLVDGTAKVKSGYRKILFCQERASHDGQTYFWVDTCCIDKANHVELNTAITSMFDWYAKATKCYVYLSDVNRGLFGTAEGCNLTWQSQFRKCRWLSRGWTLQELLAPRVVEFYDQTRMLLGDKMSLESDFCEVTGIPAAALQGRPLTSYSIEERLAWQRNRRTKKPEDIAYSLSGICGVSMIPVYGEGRDRAMARLRKEIDDVFQAICDNYDNPRIGGNTDSAAVDIRDFLPQAFQGSVIVTTRSSLVKIGRSMPVQRLVEVRESVEILSNTSNRSLSANDPDVLALLSRLDGLPLALATTGSYLDQVTVGIAEYSQLYECSWLQLHEDEQGLDTYADRTLRSTWQVSLDRIERQNEFSSRLLRLWCYFGHQDLWYELLRDGPTEDLHWLRRLTESLPVFTCAMRLLCNYGLAQGDLVSGDSAGSGGYSIHACVHSWTVQVLNKEWDHALATFAVQAIGQHVHKMQEAEEIYLRALEGKEEAWGPKHTSTLDTVFNLSIFYSNQHRHLEAEWMCLRAIEGYKDAEENHETDIAFLEELLTQLEVGRVPREKASEGSLTHHTRSDAAKEDTRKVKKRDRIFHMLRRT